MKTKVWLVIWGLKDGGAEVLARDYARLVDKRTFEATIVTMYPFTDTANYRHAKAAGLEIRSIFKKRNFITRAVRALLGNWYIPMVLKGMLAKEQPDTIHFNSKMATYFSPLQKQLEGITLLYTCHSEAREYFSEEEETAIQKLIRHPGLRMIALHEDMKRELNQRFGKDDAAVVRNGVDIESFREVSRSAEDKRGEIGIPQDAYVVGHVGRFSKEKNHIFLINVFQEIVKKKSNAHLLLIGNGELQEEIEQEIIELRLKERVTILSHRTDIPELLHAMDVMVFPSLFEGLSVTLVEAQASGLKCVISDTINPANYLSEKTIPVSLNESAEAWAEIVLDDTAKNAVYGNIEDYDMSREIRRLEGLYQGHLDV